MPAYPYTIENGAGEWLTFERRAPGVHGDRIEGRALVAPGAGPPMHVHFLQEEGFEVVEGRLGIQRPDEEPQFAGTGETVVFRAGEPHRFWNAGEQDLRCLAYIEPAGNAELFLAALFASQKTNGGGRPSIWDVAYLTRRYRSEYAILGIPGFVQHIVFPAVVVLGRILGRYRKFVGAPDPISSA